MCGGDEAWGKMLRFTSNKAERQAAERIYVAVLTAARRPAFYTYYGVPDTFQGRFEMVTLHLFAVLHPLMHDPGSAPELARLVSERFVEDMDSTFREMGVGDLSVPKRMRTLYSAFAGRFDAYKGAMESDEDDLAGAIARNVFPDGEGEGRASELAAYLAESVGAVRAVDLTTIRGGEIPFPPAAEEDRA